MDEPGAMIERALVRIRRLQQARHLQRRATDSDTPADAARFRFLDALDGGPGGPGGLPISQVADAIGVDRPRASRLTTELVADGLVERGSIPGDSRFTRVRLTARGRDLVAHVHETRRRAVGEALAGFTDEEAATFATLFERFVDAWPG